LVRRYALYSIALVLTGVIPIALWRREWAIYFQWNTYGADHRIFEIWGLLASVALLVIAVIEIRARKPSDVKELIVVIAPFLVGFGYIHLITNYSKAESDWQCFSQGALALMRGESPYKLDLFPLPYPPGILLLMPHFYSWLKGLTAFFYGNPLSEEDLWRLMYFWHQVAQWFGIIGAYLLLYGFARKLKLEPLIAAVLCLALLWANNPIIRELKFGQPNIWILDIILAAILLTESHPYLAGAVAALGGHLKLYPFALLWGWVIKRRWIAVVSTVVVAVVVVGVHLLLGHGELWRDCVKFWSGIHPLTHFRNNNLQGAIGNIIAFVIPSLGPQIPIIQKAALVGVFIWMVVRAVIREKTGDGDIYGHISDALTMALLMSPDVWSHTFVIAMPVVVYSIARFWYRHPWAIGIAVCMIIAFTTNDIFPFSYHRLAGLILLLIATHPLSFFQRYP